MNMKEALSTAKKLAGEYANFSAHYGATSHDRAVRISGCSPEDAGRAARILRDSGQYPNNGFRLSADSALYWLD